MTPCGWRGLTVKFTLSLSLPLSLSLDLPCAVHGTVKSKASLSHTHTLSLDSSFAVHDTLKSKSVARTRARLGLLRFSRFLVSLVYGYCPPPPPPPSPQPFPHSGSVFSWFVKLFTRQMKLILLNTFISVSLVYIPTPASPKLEQNGVWQPGKSLVLIRNCWDLHSCFACSSITPGTVPIYERFFLFVVCLFVCCFFVFFPSSSLFFPFFSFFFLRVVWNTVFGNSDVGGCRSGLVKLPTKLQTLVYDILPSKVPESGVRSVAADVSVFASASWAARDLRIRFHPLSNSRHCRWKWRQ